MSKEFFDDIRALEITGGDSSLLRRAKGLGRVVARVQAVRPTDEPSAPEQPQAPVELYDWADDPLMDDDNFIWTDAPILAVVVESPIYGLLDFPHPSTVINDLQEGL